MTSTSFKRTLRAFQTRMPFQDFTVELVSGNRFRVEHPEALVYGDSVAVFFGRGGDMIIFDHEGVSQFSTGETKPSSPRQSRRPR